MPVSSPRAFTPTPAQLRFLDYVHAHPGFSTIAELCASCDVDPSSYYKWCHDPAFKQWLTAEWSSRLLFEGWHFLNLARANCTNSATHFRVLMNLLFDPKGQAALTAWQEAITPPAGPSRGQPASHAPSQPAGSKAGGGASNASAAGCPRPIKVESQVPSNQSNPPANSSFSAFSAPVKPNPGMTAKHLALNLSRLHRQPLRDPSPHHRPPAVPRHRPHFRSACHARGPAPVNARTDARSLPASPVAPVPGGVEPPAPPVTAAALLPHLARIFTLDNPFSLPLVLARLRCARLMLHAVEIASLEDRLAQLEQNVAA